MPLIKHRSPKFLCHSLDLIKFDQLRSQLLLALNCLFFDLAHSEMAPRHKRKEPVTPSPRKRSTRNAKQPWVQPNIILDGGQLQTVFLVEHEYKHS